MLATALTQPPLLAEGTALTIMREQDVTQPVYGEPNSAVRAYLYEPGNAVTTGREFNGAAKAPINKYVPKTDFGRRLLALRKSYVEHGGDLLSADEIDDEIRKRRGYPADA